MPKRQSEIEEIVFEKVYPLYGAIDIRNSTVERNAALQSDLVIQFKVLLQTLQQLKKASGFALIDEKIFLAKKWLVKIKNAAGFNEEIGLNDFLDNDIIPFLVQFRDGNPSLAQPIDAYFDGN